MSSLRVAQEISKDGKRKAVIEELRASLCKVGLFYDDFCAMEMICAMYSLACSTGKRPIPLR